MNIREKLKDKKRVVIKIGSSSLTHKETGRLDLIKMEILVRELADLHNQGKDVIVVSSGAIAVGRAVMGIHERPSALAQKQACAAIGQARLMMIYQKLFAEYNQTAAQVLLTKYTMINDRSRNNARNTLQSLLHMGAIPIVNENDTVSTDEIEFINTFGDNDTLSALVAALVDADMLILLSDIDGLFTDDPHLNPEKLRKQCGNRGYGYQTIRCQDCYLCRSGYGHCQRRRFPCNPQDHGRKKLRNLIPGRQKRPGSSA